MTFFGSFFFILVLPNLDCSFQYLLFTNHLICHYFIKKSDFRKSFQRVATDGDSGGTARVHPMAIQGCDDVYHRQHYADIRKKKNAAVKRAFRKIF